MSTTPNPLAKLREPFAPNQISKLPKPYKKDSPKGNCKECGGYHGLPAVHLSYVGHAAATDRLLDTDLAWTWEPIAYTPEGLPAFDRNSGLWIKLTVCGVTRIGYGSADGKTGGDAIKEIIGDALRNAGMRFGMALDLWHKGDLHVVIEGHDENGEIIEPISAKDARKVINPETGRLIDPMSPNQARKDGRGAAYDRMGHEITDLTAVSECIAWGNQNKAIIETFPTYWQDDLRNCLSRQIHELRAASEAAFKLGETTGREDPEAETMFHSAGDDGMAGDDVDDQDDDR